MAKMYPKSLASYEPTPSEQIVYNALKTQLPDTFEVFYSVGWTSIVDGITRKSEADFVIVSAEYGYLCLEVKGGDGIRIDNNEWFILDHTFGDRKLKRSPYVQAEESMYYFKNLFSSRNDINYMGIFGCGVIFPFYSLPPNINLDNRARECTIDAAEMSELFSKIKKMFRMWAGTAFGRMPYSKAQHEAFLSLIRERIAISAAAGSLVRYKDNQLGIINRVQDNYIYFLSNIRQFYVRGGAGTGKTWIAMKMAEREAEENDGNVMFLCASPKLAEMVRENISNKVKVYDITTLFSEVIDKFEEYKGPLYEGILRGFTTNVKKYDAIFVDEAQDFTEEWALVVTELLRVPKESRFGVFYDDVQIFKEQSFADGFGIGTPPYLLRENIRNTANIYNWAAEKTNLGIDVIANPVEGPTPETHVCKSYSQLTQYLENNFNKYLIRENLPNSSLVVLTDDMHKFMSLYGEGFASWKFVTDKLTNDKEIRISSVENYKGLEADMVIYVRNQNACDNANYVAYTRAKYYLIELVINF